MQLGQRLCYLIRIHISKKNRQHNSQKYTRQSTKHTYKTKYRVARTPLKPRLNSGAQERIQINEIPHI
jgi:hypothetical protein